MIDVERHRRHVQRRKAQAPGGGNREQGRDESAAIHGLFREPMVRDQAAGHGTGASVDWGGLRNMLEWLGRNYASVRSKSFVAEATAVGQNSSADT